MVVEDDSVLFSCEVLKGALLIVAQEYCGEDPKN